MKNRTDKDGRPTQRRTLWGPSPRGKSLLLTVSHFLSARLVHFLDPRRSRQRGCSHGHVSALEGNESPQQTALTSDSTPTCHGLGSRTGQQNADPPAEEDGGDARRGPGGCSNRAAHE